MDALKNFHEFFSGFQGITKIHELFEERERVREKEQRERGIERERKREREKERKIYTAFVEIAFSLKLN